MDLQQHAKAALGQAMHVIQPFDNVHLPEGLVARQRARVNARSQNAQLTPITRLGQRDVAHMVLEVEIRIVCPVGLTEAEGYAYQFAAENGGEMQPGLHQGQDLLEPHLATPRGTLVVNTDTADMLRHALQLCVYEHRILA